MTARLTNLEGWMYWPILPLPPPLPPREPPPRLPPPNAGREPKLPPRLAPSEGRDDPPLKDGREALLARGALPNDGRAYEEDPRRKSLCGTPDVSVRGALPRKVVLRPGVELPFLNDEPPRANFGRLEALLSY